MVNIKVAGVQGKDLLVKTTLYYGNKNIKITTESPHSIPSTQEVVIDFTAVRLFRLPYVIVIKHIGNRMRLDAL